MSQPAQRARLFELKGIQAGRGFTYLCELPPDCPPGDSNTAPLGSQLDLLEDGQSLGPPHSVHADISTLGGGRFSHWQNALYFSTSDNTDPRRNRRHYQVYVPPAPADPVTARLHALVAQAAGATGDEAYAAAEAMFYTLCPEGFIGEARKACWEDQPFVEDYHRLVPGNRRSFERKFVVSQYVKSLRGVDGDMAECGVFNGATAYFMAKASADTNMHRVMHLFDSFQGLSQPDRIDGQYWQAGALAIGADAARTVLAPYPDVHFYPGWIPERFHEVESRSFAFVHIDVDLHGPTLESLRFFYPRLVSGGVLICDDYGFTSCPGAMAAVDEFMTGKPESVIHLPTGQGVIIRK